MKKINNGNLKLAVQKDGRLAAESINLLKKAGLEFESYTRSLFTTVKNFPLEILYLREKDIPYYIQEGAADIGIVGENIVLEQRLKVKYLSKLGFGRCNLSIAVPKESKFKTLKDLDGLRIATSYPQSTSSFLKKAGIDASIVLIRGSVEISPALGMADAVCDLVSTGSTLALNDLRVLDTVFTSEALLVGASNPNLSTSKQLLLAKFLTRVEGVLSAQKSKYIMMNAPAAILPRIKKLIPGLLSPTISPLERSGWISIQSLVAEDVFWDTIEELKKIGAQGILVLPIEKIIL